MYEKTEIIQDIDIEGYQIKIKEEDPTCFSFILKKNILSKSSLDKIKNILFDVVLNTKKNENLFGIYIDAQNVTFVDIMSLKRQLNFMDEMSSKTNNKIKCAVVIVKHEFVRVIVENVLKSKKSSAKTIIFSKAKPGWDYLLQFLKNIN